MDAAQHRSAGGWGRLNTMKPTARTLDFIAGFEGFRSISYADAGGIWTIGYGTTRIYDQPVTLGMQLNEAVAKVLLYADAAAAMQAVERLVTVPLTDDQRDALTSFVYNVGATAFERSTLLRELNAERPIMRDYFTRWNKAHINGELKTLPGLTIRRGLEYQRFMREA